MNARKLPNGNLLVPRTAEGKGGMIGDGMVEVKPGMSEYDEWLPFAEGADKPTSTGAERLAREIAKEN